MGEEKVDTKADIGAAADRGESISLTMPMPISESCRQRGELTDLALELALLCRDE